jgi:exopolyphosphatase/guanosine-5'-triphosphate,3'-diphosphate pyrophosphatase
LEGALVEANAVKTAGRSKPKLGLRAWMERVLDECERASSGFEADPVHDLRVALRRCRSLSDGIMAMDPDSAWKDMKKAGKKLFQALGDLRDMQVMEAWIAKLGEAGDPVAVRLLEHVRGRTAECKQEAFQDVDQFDRKQWRQWARTLPRRAARVRPGSVVFKHLALEKWTAAYDLHKRAMRTRSQTALHELRIGLKRFRYTVENFLPRQHAAWGADLKELQDLLGEVHDLDVLWATAVQIGAFLDPESRGRWREKLNQERAKRVARYRERMLGPQSLWRVWRGELPSGPQLRAAAMNRLRVWASFLDPDFTHAQRVVRLALQLFDGLAHAGLLGVGPHHDSRIVLEAAALLHDVGKVKGDKSHHKDSFNLIQGMAVPAGWTPRELELAAVVARYHRGALPRLRNQEMQRLDLPDRKVALRLSGVLRLANRLDFRNGTDPNVHVEVRDRVVAVQVAGYRPLERSAENIAAAGHLLETVLRRPLLVRGMRVASREKRVARS